MIRAALDPLVGEFAEGGTDAQAYVGRSADDAGVTAHLRLERTFFGERRTAIGAFREMIFGESALVSVEFVVRLSGEVLTYVLAAIQL